MFNLLFSSESKPVFDPVRDLPSIKGKVVIVTGGNRGTGYGTVKHLYNLGAKVYLAARSESNAKAAIERLRKECASSGSGGEVVWLPFDLSSPEKAKKSAEGFMEKEGRLDILVNNAAYLEMLESAAEVEKLEFSHQMMVNHFGVVAFTKTLLPILTKTSQEHGSDVRIVVVASEGHKLRAANDPNLSFNTIDDLKNKYPSYFIPAFDRYTVSKLANILYCTQLQKKLSSDPATSRIICISLDPGWVDSTSQRLFPSPLWRFLMSFKFVPPEEGAWNSAWAAAAEAVRAEEERYKGAYLVPVGKFGVLGANARREELGEGLWRVTEEYFGGLGI